MEKLPPRRQCVLNAQVGLPEGVKWFGWDVAAFVRPAVSASQPDVGGSRLVFWGCGVLVELGGRGRCLWM